MPSVDVSIVTWNSASALRNLLESLEVQTLAPASITVVDNASTDTTLAICKDFPNVRIFSQSVNTGFAKGHNIGIAQGRSDFVLIVNPDVVLAPTYLEVLMDFANAMPQLGSCVGVVRRPDGKVDTAGIRVQGNRLVREITEAPVLPKRIFGVSGAIALYRREALHAVAVGGQYYDESLFAYKEDVQLAWRLQWANWVAFCVPAAQATHTRAVGVEAKRSQRDPHRRYLSYRNHLLLYPTVEGFGTWLPDAWQIIPTEIFRCLYLLITDARVTLRALAAVRKMWHAARTFAKQQHRTVATNRMRNALQE